MWQRLQTIFLSAVVIIMIACLFLPQWKHVDPSGIRYEYYPLHYTIYDGEERNTSYFPYAITAVLMAAAATVAVQTIRRYDNRLTQIKLAAFNTLLLMGVMGTIVYFSYKLDSEFNQAGMSGMSRLGLWTVFAGVFCNWVAMRLIRRDEKIVRDSDRLR
ncbi:MAG TPA: DUF4293 domain-containing protein [Cyclobacteriaceae bacterium]|nr:DUF4293 domain-containing protein [Cyclobacteriaceae bacterium]